MVNCTENNGKDNSHGERNFNLNELYIEDNFPNDDCLGIVKHVEDLKETIITQNPLVDEVLEKIDKIINFEKINVVSFVDQFFLMKKNCTPFIKDMHINISKCRFVK